MATATRVTLGPGIGQLTIEADDGRRRTYAVRGHMLHAEPPVVHVQVDVQGQAELARRGDGTPELHQAAPGLPSPIYVAFPGSNGPAPHAAGGWHSGLGWYEYRRLP